MEPLTKRQRLYSPVRRAFPQTFDDQHAYYDETADDEILEDEEEFEDEEPLHTHADLGQRRAQLDFKLKSTFEAIFEKYGKDFDGVGDEIDLATGEILVNNGHLMEMKNERDAGDSGRGRRPLMDLEDESEDMPTSSLGETDMLDEEEDDEDEDEEEEIIGEDDLVDDDMILRGFTQANRFVQASPKVRTRPQSIMPQQERHYPIERRASTQGKSLPSRSEIMAQFGPQLGPQIVEYVSERQVPDESHIEPAWRVPELPGSKPSKRPVAKAVTLPLQSERSPSPEASPSIWAPTRPRGRRRRDGADSAAIFRGQSTAPKKQHRSLSLDPLSDPVNFDISQSPRNRQTFTVQDNQILQAFVAQAKSQNLDVLSKATWVKLEHKYPHHSWSRWKEQYKLKFTYLWPNPTDESDISTSETSIDTCHRIDQANSDLGHPHMLPQAEIRPPLHNHPARIRKPAEKDTRIMSWSQAVDAIETFDPDLHAGMMEDNMMMEAAGQMNHAVSSSFGKEMGLPNVHSGSVHSSSQLQESHITGPQIRGELWSDSMDVEFTPQPKSTIPRAPCLHADCRTFPTHLYRLQRKDDEDLSEMCLHLFHTHHTTPYPCSEPNCGRNGTEGFFLQVDLVRHVKISHNCIGALQRLRGRVNEELLSRHARPGSSREKPELQNDSLAKQFDSDFMAASVARNTRFPSSNANLSSSSGADRTLTPRTANGPSAVSELTPMTSLSSIMVHHPSNAMSPRHNDEYHENNSFVLHTEQESINVNRVSRSESSMPENQLPRSARQSPQLPLSRELSDHPPDTSARRSLPTPQASTGGSLGPSLGPVTALERQQRVPPIRPGATTIVERMPIRTRSPTAERLPTKNFRTPIPSEIPNSHSSMNNIPSSSSSIAAPAPQEPVASEKTLTSFFRNAIDASYEFSDEEDGVATVLKPRTAAGAIPDPIMTPAEPSVVKLVVKEKGTRAEPAVVKLAANKPLPAKAVTPKPAVTEMRSRAKPTVVAKKPLVMPVAPKRAVPEKNPIAGPVATAAQALAPDAPESSAKAGKMKNILPPVTPASRVLVKKSVVSRLLDDDEVDELSMTADEFILLSSKAKSQPKAKSATKIKTQALAKPPGSTKVQSALKGKKRKLDDFQSDEASSSKPAAPETTDPVIKSEVNDSTPILPVHPKNKRRPRKVPTQQASILTPVPGNKSLQATAANERCGLRTKTPLLDLTPTRAIKHKNIGRDEISDSAAELSSPLAGFSTPSHKRSLGDPLLSGQALPVVKTPGGTWRRCGEEDFKCQRSFCFRCAPKAVVLKT